MSFALSEETKKELREECMKEAYKHFKLTKTISDNRFYFYLSSQNLRGHTDAGDNNGLEFIFPPELNNHITDARIKVLDCKLPEYYSDDLKDFTKYYINMTGGILKKQNYGLLGNGRTDGQHALYPDILASGTKKSLNEIDIEEGDRTAGNSVILVLQDGTLAYNDAALAADAPDNTAVGAVLPYRTIGYYLDLDGEWRACNNPAGKTAKITFTQENIGNDAYDFTRDEASTYDWTMTLCLELLPDFMRNDKIMF